MLFRIFSYSPLLALVLVAGCVDKGSLPGPSPLPTEDRAVSSPAVPTSPASIVGLGWTFTGPEPACLSSSQAVTWVFAATQIGELTRLYPHAFRSPQAGCANTTEQLVAWTPEGPVEYRPGSSGTTTFHYPANEVRCGRVELGVLRKDATGHDTMLSWVIVNSGVDCAPPPPPPPPPPVPPTPPPPPPCIISGDNRCPPPPPPCSTSGETGRTPCPPSPPPPCLVSGTTGCPPRPR